MAAKKYLLAGFVVGLVALVVVIAITPLGAPRPQAATAPVSEFSSQRAMALLRAIAAEPRPIGSAANHEARELIFARLSSLGLHPHVQTAAVVSAQDSRVAGTVHNVVGRLAGRDPSRALLLVAHYDSVPSAAGAADDGSGVAALLEVARALRAGAPLRNDVIFLFTDGEERGLLGAQAFLRDDPWAFAAGVALNFDNAGSSSPALMYETSAGGGRLVREYLAVTQPYTSSLMNEVSRRQPIASDFRVFLARGTPGMSFGMLDGPAYNHTAYDSLANFREAGMQHEGDTALALARRLGDLDLWDVHGADIVYFDVVDGLAVAYRDSLVIPLLLAAAACYTAAVASAARRRLLTWTGLAWSVLGTAVTLGASLLVVAIVWTMYRTAYEERIWSDTGVVISDWYRVGLVLLAAAVVLAAYALLLRRLRVWDLAVVALAWWLAGDVVLSVFVPGASFLLTWPLAGGAIGLAVAAAVGGRATGSSAVVGRQTEPVADGDQASRPLAVVLATLVGAVPGLVLMSSNVYLLLMSAGLKHLVTVLAVWLMAGLLILPLAAVLRAFRLWLPAALAAAGIVVLFAVGSTVAYDSEHPKFTSVYYRQDPDGTVMWQAIDRVDDYTRPFLAERLHSRFLPSYFPQLGTCETVIGAAPPIHLRPPSIELLSDTTDGDRRTVRLRLRSRRDAAVVSLLVHTVVGYLTASVAGQRLGAQDTTVRDGTSVRWAFDYHAPPARGVIVTVRFASGPPVLLRAVDFTHGLPAQASGRYPARPAGMLPARLGDGVLAETTLRLPATAPGPW